MNIPSGETGATPVAIRVVKGRRFRKVLRCRYRDLYQLERKFLPQRGLWFLVWITDHDCDVATERWAGTTDQYSAKILKTSATHFELEKVKHAAPMSIDPVESSLGCLDRPIRGEGDKRNHCKFSYPRSGPRGLCLLDCLLAPLRSGNMQTSG